MGIPKLSRDLEPYREHVVLGIGCSNPQADRISRLVIDGPGLVYFVYHQLLAMGDRKANPFDAQPSCAEVCETVRSLLLAFQNQGVEIEAIYFDGYLPVQKRSVRIQRMERSRERLAAFCRVCAQSYARPVSELPKTYKNGIELLARPTTLLSRSVLLPEPPFMVPAVIEELRREDIIPSFKEIVHLVRGEADIYCAAHAQRTGAAVLSNDSDLLGYDLGETSSILILGTLEAALSDDGESCEIRCLRWRPHKIAKKLGLQNLTRLVFERFSDPSISFHSVKNRAQQSQISARRRVELEKFREEYAIKDDLTGGKLMLSLDTRTSELYYQFEALRNGRQCSEDTTAAHIYLPVVVENHMRTSSWNIGLNTRILAYSLLNLSLPDHLRRTSVVEILRSGNRIISKGRELYDYEQVSQNVQQLLGITSRIKKAIQELTLDGLFLWRLLGLHEVCRDLSEAGKQAPDMDWMLKFLANGYVDDELTLDAVHVDANIQVAVYSFRILKQLCAVSRKHLESRLISQVVTLEDCLADMPSLTEIFASRLELYGRMNRRPQPHSMGQALALIYDETESLD
ncbi:hypothetical protein UCRPC4_g04388 [Phaeomoniella chlamydospora]|uniref:Asteroid domain-containing protein n=1 Tax=Phaeomoniella chlamydospora TaxID=158046 RepID=A0A0G2EBW0_PHACM|nr:hypothetical protein UCRPC4_g04388 [Phaeomoniella chlamydospora]